MTASLRSTEPHSVGCLDHPRGGDLGKALSSVRSDAASVRSAAIASSDAELTSFGLRAYQLNLLSLFGATWSRTRIDATARAAAISKIIGGWEYHQDYLPTLGTMPDAPRLNGMPFDLIKSLLARGRGLVIMSFHLGHMRYVPSDLVHGGIPTCVPLARDAFGNYSAARSANASAALWRTFRTVNVEEPGGTLALARTLANGGCVFSTIDGNTGLDGPRGDQRRATVRVLAATARVKTGLFGMAARFGSPILFLVAHTQGADRVCRAGPLIDPPFPLSHEDADPWIAEAVQTAYDFFGTCVTDHADEWCGGDLFHQWRLPRPAPRRDPAQVEQELARCLEAGGTLKVDHSRVVEMSDFAGDIWSDAVSGSCIKVPAEMTPVARQLSGVGGGVDAQWLGRLAPAHRSRLWSFLCKLGSRELIRPVHAQDADREVGAADAADVSEGIARPSTHGACDVATRSASILERL